MEAIQATRNLTVHWRSYELHPAGTTVPDRYRDKVLASRPQLAEMLWELLGVRIDPGPWGISSHRALVGAKVAQAQGEAAERAYHRAILDAYWLHGRDISQTDVLRACAAQAGLDADDFMQALDERAYEVAVRNDIELAQRIGIQGVPALIVDKQHLISGFLPPDDLSDALDEIAASRADSAG